MSLFRLENSWDKDLCKLVPWFGWYSCFTLLSIDTIPGNLYMGGECIHDISQPYKHTGYTSQWSISNVCLSSWAVCRHLQFYFSQPSPFYTPSLIPEREREVERGCDLIKIILCFQIKHCKSCMLFYISIQHYHPFRASRLLTHIKQ